MHKILMGISNILLAFVFMALSLSLLTTFSSASPTTNPWNISCVNGVEYDLLCNGLCSNPGAVVVNHTFVCNNGCNNVTNSCDTPYNVPSDFYEVVIVCLIVISALFIVIGMKFNDDWGVIRTLFYISAIIFIVAAIGVMSSFFSSTQSGISNVIGIIYLAVGFIMFIFIAYVILRWILAFAIKFLHDIEAKKRRMSS